MASTTVNFNLKTAGYVNYANQTLTFRLLTAGAEAATGDQSYVTLPGVVTATSAANGDGSVSLFRNGKSGIESVYEVILPNREKAKFIIPSGSATIELATLLVDHVPGGSDTQQSSVYAEAIKRANHTGTQTLSTISNAGTIASQASNNVSISGGSISGVTLTASTANLTDASNKRLMTDAQETKLDSVESSADVTDTANVTSAGALMDSECAGGDPTNVKALNQSVVSGAAPNFATTNMTDASNKRLMTDAQESKLDGIEASADVTDATNVTAAGALMDSECAGGDPTNVKALNQSLVSGASPTFNTANMTDASGKRFMSEAQETKLDGIAAGATGNLTNNEIRNAVEAADDSNTFNDADHSKLNAIEASADVTDTANVTNAGALMDSEMQDGTGAAIKALTLPASPATTISAFAQTFLDDADAAAVKSTLAIVDSAEVSNFVPRSITFTNTSAYLSLADNAALDVDAGDFSLSFWARLDTLPNDGTEPILTKLSGTGYRLKFSTGSLILTMQDSGGSANFTLATGLNDNKWHVYVVTVDRSGNAIAYVDNVAQTAVGVSGTASTLANSGQLQIGSDGGSNAGDGIALGNYIALHKAVLTDSQAAQIYFSADAALTAVAPTLMVDLRKADKTFTDVSASGLAVTTNGTLIFNEGRITTLSGLTSVNSASIASPTIVGTNVLALSSLGYTAGGGGTVPQGDTSGKGTAVALNKINGEIVMDDASLANNATAVFTFNNTTIAATDVVIVNIASGVAVAGSYQVTVGGVAANSCSISVLNVSGAARTDAIKLNFAVIKAVKT